MKTKTLPSGAEMPLIGLGTWTLRGTEAADAVATALELGYRHIDTAVGYGNHRSVAAGIQRAGVPRQELFIVTKVPRENLRYEEVLAAAAQSLDELQTDYLDLLLIHWPNPDVPMRETFTAFGELHSKGIVRDVGVSNFTIAHLEEALAVTPTPIANDQVLYHPQRNQEALRRYCEDKSVVVTSYSPLGRGEFVNERSLRRLAETLGHTPAQLILKWLVEKGVVVIPRSRSREHLAENLDLFGWELDKEARRVLDGMGGQ
jgi:diketogulonate reductase-like aldo/keto reductase